jgi:hypothetical protein
LRANQRSNKVKVKYEIGGGGFKFSETMLAGIEFRLKVM